MSLVAVVFAANSIALVRANKIAHAAATCVVETRGAAPVAHDAQAAALLRDRDTDTWLERCGCVPHL